MMDDDNFWKEKYQISWCHHCDTAIILCPDCENSSCNGGGCSNCTSTFVEFNKGKVVVQAYLSAEEIRGYDRVRYLQRYILQSLANGSPEIDWQKLRADGQMSAYSEELFAKELANGRRE